MKNEPVEYYFIFDERAESDTALMDKLANLRKSGNSIVTQKIETPRDTSRFAAAAAAQNAQNIVGIGGDGTLNLIVNGILSRQSDAACAVGLIPYGTGNDFAGANGIPLDDPLTALDILVRNDPVPIDIGQINETFFVNVITGGFPAKATATTSRTAKKLLGSFAYLFTGITNIGNLDAQEVRFSAPGFDWKGSIYAFGLGNGRWAGGGIAVSPKAMLNDGLLDLMLIPEVEDLLTLFTDYIQVARAGDSDRIVYIQVPWLHLSVDEPIHLNIDGEPAQGTDFHFKVHEQRMRICLPEDTSLLL